jgi:5-(carboxyamino)imidazole ribonucleotide mutase
MSSSLQSAPEAAPPVEVVMGSSSDLAVMQGAVDVLTELHVACSVRVVSAHRTPLDMVEFGRTARARGTRVIVAGAGGAAHLPGMLAALTTLPVLGVPVPLARMDGLDSLLSIVQMPAGVPVGTLGIGNARNAGILAARILSLDDPDLARRLDGFATALADRARAQDDDLTTQR